MMWIKVTEHNNRDVFVNCDNVDLIIPSNEGCNILFSTSEIPLRVKTTSEELDVLLDVKSTERYINKVKSVYKHYTDTGATYITSEPKESEKNK